MGSEVWKKIRGYEEFYEISSLGNVRSLDRISNNRRRKGKLCKPFIRNKYFGVALSKDGYVKQYSIHRLLAEAFIHNPDNKPTVNHIDGNKTNNELSNLEWATHSEQIIHAINHKLFFPHPVKCEYTEELRNKRRVARLGWIFSEETKKKIAASSGKKVICITDNIEFDSIKDAASYSGIPKTTFHRKFYKGELIDGKKYEFITWYNQNKQT